MKFCCSSKIILAATLLIASGFAFSNSEYLYNEVDGGIEIIGCSGDCALLPELVDGKNVVGISDRAFVSVFTGQNFSSVWDYDGGEFSWFNNDIIPSDTPISILDQNPDSISNQGFVFPEFTTLYESSIGHNQASLKIPAGYNYIGDNFFSRTSLINISLNEGLKTVGVGAFSSNKIKDIVLPNSISKISRNAFALNPLSHIIFLGNRPDIADEAFETLFQRLSRQLKCLLEAREKDKDYNDCFSPLPSSNFSNCNKAIETSEIMGSTPQFESLFVDDSCGLVANSVEPSINESLIGLDFHIKMSMVMISPEIEFNFNFFNSPSTNDLLCASLNTSGLAIDPETLTTNISADLFDCLADLGVPYNAGFDIDSYISLLSENFDTPIYELGIDDLMSVFESDIFTKHESLDSIPVIAPWISFPEVDLYYNPTLDNFENLPIQLQVFPSIEIPSFVNQVIDGYSSLVEYKMPPIIYYCAGTTGWPGAPINGVMPEERDCDSVVWDIDQNDSVDALTDGLLLMRYAFGMRGDSLTENTISPGSLVDKVAVEQNIEQIMHLLDINDDGNFDALTDALILLRYLFDMTGNGLVDEDMLTSNRPTQGSIKAYIESHMIKRIQINVPH